MRPRFQGDETGFDGHQASFDASSVAVPVLQRGGTRGMCRKKPTGPTSTGKAWGPTVNQAGQAGSTYVHMIFHFDIGFVSRRDSGFPRLFQSDRVTR